MINFSGAVDGGPDVAIGPNFIATVQHNGSNSASYGDRVVGGNHALNYQAIDIRGTGFRLVAPDGMWGATHDYMLQRQSKVQTDVTWNPVSTITDAAKLYGNYVYHSGGGSMGDWVDGKVTNACGPYAYIIGGIMTATGYQTYSDKGSFVLLQNLWYGEALEGASEKHPLPNAVRGGDSGSPVYIYNEATGQYEYVGAQEGIAGNSFNWTAGNTEWTAKTMESFNVHVDMSAVNTVYLNAVATQGDTINMDGYGTTIWTGAVTNAAGDSLASYKGVKTGLNTWSDLSDRKDVQNWYAYNASGGDGGYLNQSIQDLFYNENLAFDAAESSLNNSIVLKDTVDLGIGYAEFNDGRFTITSESGENNQFDHAGYVINEGAEVHLRLRNPDTRMTEWRKIGAGDLYIDGSGNTNALLNLGGTGTTYLQQQNGYAAYNVLANTGATVVIQDLQQIVRDFTFGAGGGTLDMHGNSMEWRTSSDAEGRFTINALTEDAMITNTSGNVTLTYTESGDTKYLGSFRDTKDAALTIDYQGGGTWELNSIHTNLSNNDGSGLIVSNGKVLLTGTHTVHGMGSLNGKDGSRLELANDWHYADAAMDVAVKDGATFELGSHARLTGDVTVDVGATFIMREGVQHRMEYVEGGVSLEDTNQYAAYFGLKGNVELGGDMCVEFSAGADSRLSYNGDISGAGSLSVALGTDGGILELGGDNSGFTGSKKIESGGVVLVTSNSSGNTSDNKWLVSTEGWISNQAESAEQLLARVDEASTGTMALSTDTVEQLDMQHHQSLTLGAEIGKTVQYGEAGTNIALEAWQGAWRLGGGGGELVVNYKLSGENDLILGASGHSSGVVTLTNTQNDFSGDITFSGKGIVLNAEDGTLGNSELNLTYGNAFGLVRTDAITKNVAETSDGMVTVDAVSNQQLNMSTHHSLAIAAEKEVEFSGGITLSAGQGYLFSSASGGKLTLLSELDSSRSLVVDAQGLTGGTVVLAGNDSWSGDITVRGHRDNNGEGEISLQLGQDVAAGGTLTLAQGGILDLAGHNLSISGTIVTVGGQMTNSGSTGALIFDCSAHELTSTADLSVGTIRKTGSNMLSLGGNNAPCQFYVEEGTLRLGSDGAFTSGSTVHLGDGSTLDNRTYALLAGVSLENGTATLTSSNHNHIVVRGSVSIGDNSRLIIGKDGLAGISIDGDLSVGSGSSLAILSNSKASFTIGGNINLTEGTNLNFGNSANISLSGENIGTGSSSIVLNGGQLNLNKGGNISINSDLTINGNTTINSLGSADAMGRNFERVIVNGGELTLREESWSSVWNINSLEGSGNLHWQSTTNHSTSSRLILNGDGGFVGSISMNRTYGNKERTHGAYLELASDFVAAKADISLNGAAADAVATLAINTDNAHIKGLSGNQNSFVYAGAARVDTALSGSARPETTRSATLTIDADADYTFSGSIGNTKDTSENGITLVKTGSGTQTLNGASVVLSNVGALAGTLNITSSSLTVSGNVSLARGAELKLGDSYSLNEGQKLYLMAGAENSGAAVFNSALVFNGGSISIDARGLSVDSPLLALGGAVTVGSSFGGFCQLEFSNSSVISMGTDYLLATGDWSAVAGKLTCDTGEYLTATLGATSNGLQVTFALADGYSVWRGDESVLQAGSKVLFGGFGGSNDVALSAPASIGSAYFDNLSDVTVSSANGASLTAELIEKHGTGALVINNTVNGDTLRVAESSLLTGSGRLAVDTMEISRGAQASISKLTVVVESAITGDGVLHMGQDSTLQVGSSVGGNVLLTDGTTLVAADSSVSTNLRLGANGADSRVSLRMGDSSGVSLNGSIAVQGNTTLSVQGSGALQFNSAFNKLAALELQSGVNLALSSELSTHLVLDGGSASLSGNDNKILDGDVTVKNGGTLTFTGTGADIIDYNKSGKTLTVAGGTIDFGSTRQTIGSWTLQLSDGAVLTGAGNATHGAMDFNINNSTIYATSGSSSISAVTRLRNGNNLNYDVSDDATLTISGRHHSSASNTMGSITQLGGGVLVLSGEALSLLTSASYVAVDEGTLDLSAAGSSANLSRVRGAGTVVLNYGVDGNGTAFDFRGLTGEVQVDSGRVLLSSSEFGSECPDFRLTSANSQLVFNSVGTVVNSNVYLDVDSTDIHVNADMSGTIGGDITGKSLVKHGAGTLTVGGNMKLDDTLSTRAGEVILTGEDNSITNVDGAMGGATTAEGTLRLAQNARLEITSNIWGRSNTGIHLDSGAELDISGKSIIITNRAEEGTASLAATTSTGPGEYTINQTKYEISNAHVTYTGGDATINNKLTNSSIENAGSGTLEVNNAENTLIGVHATGGSIKLFSDPDNAELDLKELEIATSLSVSAYSPLSENAAQEARINVSGTADFGMGVTLNADLVMKSGATLKIAGSVDMGSDVRLETGLRLDGKLLNEVKVMQAGERIALFTGIDSLYFGDATEASSAFTLLDGVKAKDYFANLTDNYFLIYDTSAGVGEGTLSIELTVPEPTTTTLSLLALAALAACRRRK